MSATIPSPSTAASLNASAKQEQDKAVSSKLSINQIILSKELTHDEKIELLKKEKLLLDKLDENGYSPLMFTAKLGIEKLFTGLLDLGAKADVKGFHDRTVLHIAAENGRVEMVKFLAKGKKPEELEPRDKDGNTPLILAAGKGHDIVCKTLIIDLKVNPKTKGNNQRNFLHHAARQGRVKVIELIPDQVMKEMINEPEQNGDTPLMLAAYFEHVAACEILIKRGADNTKKGFQGQIPLNTAGQKGNPKLITLFSATLAIENINLADAMGRTPLYLATESGNKESVESLLKLGANPTIGDKDGKFPLHIAAEKGLLDIIELFIPKMKEFKVSLDVRDQKGNTALGLANTKKHKEVIEALKTAGAADIGIATQSAAEQSANSTSNSTTNPISASTSQSEKPTLIQTINGETYQVLATRGDGACAIHAIIGEKSNRGDYFKENARAYFTGELNKKNQDAEVMKFLNSILASYIEDFIISVDTKYIKMIIERLPKAIQDKIPGIKVNKATVIPLREAKRKLVEQLIQSSKEKVKILLNCSETQINNPKILDTLLTNYLNPKNIQDKESNRKKFTALGEFADKYFENERLIDIINKDNIEASLKLVTDHAAEFRKAYISACEYEGVEGYWFSDKDIELMQILFGKRVEVYSDLYTDIPSHQPKDSVAGDLVVIYNTSGKHYSRCEPVSKSAAGSAGTVLGVSVKPEGAKVVREGDKKDEKK